MGVLWSSFQLVDNVCHTRSTAKNTRVAGRNLITSLATQSYSDLRLRPKKYLLNYRRWSTESAFVLSFCSSSSSHWLFNVFCMPPPLVHVHRVHTQTALFGSSGGRFYCKFEYKWFCQPNEIEVFVLFHTKNKIKTSTEMKSVATARPRDHESRVYIKN